MTMLLLIFPLSNRRTLKRYRLHCLRGLIAAWWHLLFLLLYSVQLLHDEDPDTFSACWIILLFP